MNISKKNFKNKLLYFDIETSLMEVYTFHIGRKVSISHDQVIKDTRVICISFMAEGWKKPKSLRWKDGDDTNMLIAFGKIAKKYPVLVAQNGDRFDVKVLNGIMWQRGLPPFKNICSLDTLKFSRQNMKLTSHKLDYKLKVLGDKGKKAVSLKDWINTQTGDQKALQKMVTYCNKDVTGLRKIFWSLLPYVNKLPISLSVLINEDREGCPLCGSKQIYNNGIRPSSTGSKQRKICKDCGNDWTDTRLKTTTDRLK